MDPITLLLIVAIAFTSLVLLILASAGAQATTYVCETQHAYTLGAGELRLYREETERMSWKTVIFDDVTGVLKYGHEASNATMPKELGACPSSRLHSEFVE